MTSGIYQIRNVENGNVYVGSATNLDGRRRRHFSDLANGKHHSKHLQRAYNKYGKSVFSFEILEYCEGLRLVEREQFFIDALRPGYNIAPVAGSSLGLRCTPEARKKISIAIKGRVVSVETRAKMSAKLMGNKRNLGHTASKAARLNMSNAQRGHKGHVFTVEERKKISDAGKGRTKSPETRAKISAAQVGKVLSAEHREKLSALAKGRRPSFETRAKMSASHKLKGGKNKNLLQTLLFTDDSE